VRSAVASVRTSGVWPDRFPCRGSRHIQVFEPCTVRAYDLQPWACIHHLCRNAVCEKAKQCVLVPHIPDELRPAWRGFLLMKDDVAVFTYKLKPQVGDPAKSRIPLSHVLFL